MNKLIIGITESGDASLKYEWTHQINNTQGSIIITKNITDKFIDEILRFKHKTILHCTCTGYGGTKVEPKVPEYKQQIAQLKKLISLGYPVQQVVLRVDPIIPTNKGLHLAQQVIEYALDEVKGLTRIRVSLIDMYKHVQERFYKTFNCVPFTSFHAPIHMQENADKLFKYLIEKYPQISIESCAEKDLSVPTKLGCVSQKDLDLLNISTSKDLLLKFNRQSCLCIANKKELLQHIQGKTGYKNCYGCLYCYWKTK